MSENAEGELRQELLTWDRLYCLLGRWGCGPEDHFQSATAAPITHTHSLSLTGDGRSHPPGAAHGLLLGCLAENKPLCLESGAGGRCGAAPSAAFEMKGGQLISRRS